MVRIRFAAQDATRPRMPLRTAIIARAKHSPSESALASKGKGALVAAFTAIALNIGSVGSFAPPAANALPCPTDGTEEPQRTPFQEFICTFLPFFCPAPQVPEGLFPMTREEASALRTVLDREVTTTNAPKLLRLAFHDAGTWSVAARNGGPNGSIMLEEEVSRPENNGLAPATEVIRRIRQGIQGTAAAGLSDADLIAAAGGFSVTKTGGFDIQVLKGRTDSGRVDPTGRLPAPVGDFNVLLQIFQRQGLDATDLVNLSGSHTIGNLPGGASGRFDNNYFQILLDDSLRAGRRGIPSDRALLTNPDARALVEAYAQDNARFQQAFNDSYLKMMNNSYSICE